MICRPVGCFLLLSAFALGFLACVLFAWRQWAYQQPLQLLLW